MEIKLVREYTNEYGHITMWTLDGKYAVRITRPRGAHLRQCQEFGWMTYDAACLRYRTLFVELNSERGVNPLLPVVYSARMFDREY